MFRVVEGVFQPLARLLLLRFQFETVRTETNEILGGKLIMGSNWQRIILTAFLYSLVSTVGLAQLIPTYGYFGASGGARLGQSVSGAGDVNNDGYDDFIVGSPGDNTAFLRAGKATVYSGFDGTVIHSLFGTYVLNQFGHSVSGLGDVDGDGFDDVVVGDFPLMTGSPPGTVRVYSGQTGAMIAIYVGDALSDEFACSLSDAGDVDADGVPDIIVGARLDDNNGTNSGNARVISGATGLTLYSFDGNFGNVAFGHSVSGAGDVNGDGFDDMIVGAPYETTVGAGPSAGAAHIYSGANGSVLHSFYGSGSFGYTVSNAGDVDHDGFDDVIVGAPHELSTTIFGAGGSATVFSGQTGAVITKFLGTNITARFGENVSDCGDVNGDGNPDVLVCEVGGANLPSIYVFTGLGGTAIETITAPVATGSDIRASGAGDLNRDGFSDIIIGRPNATNLGKTNVLVATTLPVLNYRSSQGLSGINLEWQPLGGNLGDLKGTLVGSGSSSNAVGIYGVSLARADNLVLGFPLLIAIDTSLNLIDSGVFNFDNLGTFATGIVDRQHPAIAGTLIHVQWFEISPIPASSNAIRLRMEP